MIDYLEALIADTGCVELRHSADYGRWDSYWFTDPAALAQKAVVLGDAGNLYTSINAPKLRSTYSGPVKNDDIAWITRLPFDFDPVRPTGVCSTRDELRLAEERLRRLQLSLHKRGWPTPLLACSGNGYHLMYRCRLPNTEVTRRQLKAIYIGLGEEYSDDLVLFDPSVRNPGRIIRLYGSWNRKGPDTKDRPHRKTTYFQPRDLRQVSRRQIESLAAVYTRRQEAAPKPRSGAPASIAGAGDYATLDVVSWFQAHGLYGRHLEDNKHDVVCPWEDQHSSSTPGDTIIFEATDSWPGFHCKHSHCQDRTIREVIQRLGDADVFCTRTWRAQS